MIAYLRKEIEALKKGLATKYLCKEQLNSSLTQQENI